MRFTVCVGTTNKIKINAVRRAFDQYFNGYDIVGVNIPSGVSDQPKSLEETYTGALNRACGAYAASHCKYGVGVESGVFKAIDKYMENTVIVIWDGVQAYTGFSPTWELTAEESYAVLKGLDLNEVAKANGYTADPKIGNDIGIIGLLTGGVMTREEYTYWGVIAALIRIRPK